MQNFAADMKKLGKQSLADDVKKVQDKVALVFLDYGSDWAPAHGRRARESGQKGYTNFTAFNESGTLVFTYTSDGFGVWDSSGKKYCSASDTGNGTVALSPNGRWLAAGIVNGANSISVWNLQTAIATCGIVSGNKIQ